MNSRALVVCALLAACGGSSKKQTQPATSGDSSSGGGTEAAAAPSGGGGGGAAPAQKSLYDRLGGQPAITAVVADFVGRTTTDPRIKERFYNTDAENLKKLLVEFVSVAAGCTTCKYEGRSMEDSHAGMDLVDDEFNALVEDLVASLDKFKVPEKEKNEVLGALGPLKPQIVASPDKLHPIDDAKLAPAVKLAASMKDKDAAALLEYAITAAKRGQRNWADQLFTRAEMKAGPGALASVANIFRAGAPTRITTATKKIADAGPQAKVVGGSESDQPVTKPLAGSLKGTMTIDGKTPDGFGVVMMWPNTGGYAKRVAKHRVIEQRDKAFAPHVMAVPVGSTIEFPNYDQIFHNVFSLSKTKAFDLGMYKNGESREIKVDKPGIIRLGCNLHASMSAYLIVVDAPAYVSTEPDGSFSFKSLAPGKYRVQAWNERSGDPLETEVEIKAGANTTTLDLKSGGQAISPDKFGDSRATK
jgi:hemoglobin